MEIFNRVEQKYILSSKEYKELFSKIGNLTLFNYTIFANH